MCIRDRGIAAISIGAAGVTLAEPYLYATTGDLEVVAVANPTIPEGIGFYNLSLIHISEPTRPY